MGQISPRETKPRKSSNKIKSRKSYNKTRLHPKLQEFKNEAKVNKILNNLVSHMNALIKKMETSENDNNNKVLSNFKKFLKEDGERFGLKMESGELKHINIKTSLQKGGAPKGDDTPENRLTNPESRGNNTNNSLGQSITRGLIRQIDEDGLTRENLELFRVLMAEERLQLRHEIAMTTAEDARWRRQMEWRGNILMNALNRTSRYMVGVAAYYGAHHTLQLANGITGPVLRIISSICSFIFISFLGSIVDGINGITSRIPFYGGKAIEHPRDAWDRIGDEADFGDNPDGLPGIIRDLEAAGDAGYYVSFLIFFFLYLGVFGMAYQIWNSNNISVGFGLFSWSRNERQGPGQEANLLENRRSTRGEQRRTLSNSNRSNSRSRTPSPNEGKRSKRKTKKIKKKKTRNRKSKRNNKRKNRKQSKKKKRKAKK